jgi:hypothetical protein
MKSLPKQEDPMADVKVVANEKDVIHDITDPEYSYFKSQCKLYAKKFGLMDWDLYFCLEDLSDDAELANVSWCFTGHSCRITLSSKIPFYDDYLQEIDKVARHEIFHLLLARLQEYSQRRSVFQDDIDESIEGLVRMIENVFQAGSDTVCQCQTQVCQCDE